MADISKLPQLEQYNIIAKYDINTAKHFAAFLGSYIFLFVIFRFAYLLVHYYGKRFQSFTQFLTFPTRLARRVLLRKIPKFVSGGHALTILVYILVNIVLTFTYKPPLPFINHRNSFAKRLGWMTLLNMTTTVVLSIKNNPVAILTGYSHERLNVLHRASGWCTLIFWMLHWTIYTGSLFTQGQAYPTLLQIEQIHGYIAGGGLFVMCMFAIQPIRQRFYELFVKTHMIGFLLVIINVGLHKPDLVRKAVWIVVFIGASFFLSRLVRFLVLVYNSWGNRAILMPLNGATKVVFKKTLRAKPGDHIFITIPKVRTFEAHPFTISDTTYTQLRIRNRDGFTAALHEYAQQHPGKEVSVLIDGPFGNTPDFHSYDKVLLVAGGVGATFSFAIALDIVRRKQWNDNQIIELAWIIQSEEHMEWFKDELEEIQASPHINLTVFVTRPGRHEAILEKVFDNGDAPRHMSYNHFPTIRKEEGRPDIKATVDDLISTANKTDRIIVSCCGPKMLMQEVRNTVAKSIPISGPSVTLQNEQFGW
ncbi:hypothetical protein NA57DRAFT_70900 [Rhizodiscina lignyota]|uniref:FAD-binding FR-type domain-containing protein n=1 Tax=Rhizodiscina lignyota TaxID=1504668 RepID=A0A9P4IRC0_9PEZI|nr:hypothetical protein NA57DRAFT_70900 [Rhizodiscina lignyota]